MKLISLLLSVLLCSVVFAQRYSFVPFSTAEGLPQSQVKCISQDSTGFIWVGTLGGLSKFDGQKFQNFSTEDGLFNNRVTEISFLGDKIYIGHDGGVSVSKDGQTFKAIPLPKENDESSISAIVAWQNKVFVSTNGSGLFLLDENTLEQVDLVKSQRIRDLRVYNDQLILACRGEICILPSENKIKKVEFLPAASYTSISIQEPKHIYFSSYDYGIVQFDIDDFDKLERKEWKGFKVIDEKSWRFRGVVNHGWDVYGYSKKGVIKYEKDKEIILNESSGLPLEDISTVFIDNEGNVWIGTSGKGLLKFSGEVFTYFNQETGLSSDLVLNVLQEHNKYWFSTYDSDVTTLNSQHEYEYVKLPSKTVWSSIHYQGKNFFGTNAGLFTYGSEIESEWFETDGLPGNKISALFEYENDLWIGTNKGYVSATLDSIETLTKNTSLTNVRSFVEYKNQLYCGAQAGVYKISGKSSELVFPTVQPVNAICVVNGKLWVGTEDGLFFLDNEELRAFKLADNAGASYVNFLVAKDDNLYVGTNNGVYNVVKETVIQHYGINDGIVDLESNINSGYIDAKNQMWFGTASGLVKFDLAKKNRLQNEIVPRLLITSVHFTNPELDILKYGEGVAKNGLPQNLSLPYNENNVVIEFTGLYYKNPQALKYQYKLIGAEDTWIDLGNTPRVNFTNLGTGTYTLMVKTKTDFGIESEVAEFSFEVRVAWYYSWWFVLSCILVFAYLIWLVIRFRFRRIDEKNQNETLRLTNKLIALEQQSLNASMNRHFIFNSLNSIQYFINVSDKRSANKYLTSFAQLIRKNLDSSNEGKGTVALSEEIERLELYMKLEMMRFQDKFDFKISIDPEAETELIEVPAMLLQPFVENSIIHGVLPIEDSLGRIEINVTSKDEVVEVEIVDNGIGIDASKNLKDDFAGDHKSQGMEITQGRIEILQKISNNKIELIGPYQVSADDGGTRVVVRIPILK